MTPVKFSVANQVIVDAFESLPEDQKSSNYWADDTIAPIRAEIKDHYIADQQYICVYCRRRIVTNNKSMWDAEHVISREKVPGFMFTPRNLAVSCRDCNIAKGTKEVRKTAGKRFPYKSSNYRIVHPHFDTYESHIRWIGEICVPISDKGTVTIEVCGLTRFTAKFLGIDGVLVSPGFDRHVGDLLKAKDKLEAQAAIAAIAVYAESIPQG